MTIRISNGSKLGWLGDIQKVISIDRLSIIFFLIINYKYHSYLLEEATRIAGRTNQSNSRICTRVGSQSYWQLPCIWPKENETGRMDLKRLFEGPGTLLQAVGSKIKLPVKIVGGGATERPI